MKRTNVAKLNALKRRLVRAAVAAASTAYAPYSGFSVGAALLSEEDEIITGSNVENAAYGSTICAERAALLRANAVGRRVFKTIVVASKGEGPHSGNIAAPCGACRQMLYEFARASGRNIEVILVASGGDKAVLTSIEELLPMGFGPAPANRKKHCPC